MKPDFDIKLDALKLEEHNLTVKRKAVQLKLKNLMIEIAKSDGIEIGSVVTSSGRDGKYSVTHFAVDTFSGRTRLGDIHYIAVYGVPVGKNGKPMRGRIAVFLGPSECVKVEA